MSAVLSPEKRWRNLQASAALNGIAVERLVDDYGRTVFIATRWHVTQKLQDLDAVEQLLRALTSGAPG